MDCSLPGSSVHRILQARILEWVPFPSPGHLSQPRIKSVSPELQADFLLSQPPGKPKALLSRSHSFLHMRNMWRKLVLKPLGFSIRGSAVGPGFVFCCCCCLFCLSAPECTVRVENISYVTGHLPTSMSMCPLVLAFFPDTSAPVTSAILRPLAWRLTLCPDFHKPGSSCH